MKKILTALAMLVIFPAALADDEITAQDLFQLCSPQDKIDLIVGDTGTEEASAGLTRDRIENVAESRLRAARIYDSNESDYLLVFVGGMKPTFNSGESIGDGKTLVASYELAFKKLMYDSDAKVYGFAVTWTSEGILTGKADFIVQTVSETVDRFISEFLRVNESKECREATGKGSE